MPEEIDDLVERIRQKHLGEAIQKTPGGKKKRFFGWLGKIAEVLGEFLISHKKVIVIFILCFVVVMIGVYVLAKDFLTKRQNYPERNVLFRTTDVVYIAGASEEKGMESVDQLAETEVYAGGVESKVGTYLFTTTREIRDDIEYFNMDNSQRIRIASATRKPEIVQAGLRISGSLNFKEQLAEIILSGESKAPQSYHVYKFVPERGLQEIEVTVVEYDDGTTKIDNRMIERREYGLGWFWGKDFRAGTFLERYLQSPKNRALIEQFKESIRVLDSQQTIDRTKREQILKEAMELSADIETTPIYTTFEDGFFDILPQGSTNYLAYKPSLLERAKDALLGKSDHIRLRVDNYYDFFPGRYPLLRQFHIGKGENSVYPFDKYNIGGYVIKDKYGELARIDIQDFILFYGQDVVYSYYLDLNGDGKLDTDSELLGKVLCRTTHDERLNLEKLVGKGKPKADVTFAIHYSFMAPDTDAAKGLEYFKLCGYIESMMPDQVNKGFGKNSMLGYINQQRSDIMLFKDLTIENMSRALTQESTLVAKYDIVKALIAAKRPYAQVVAEAYGIADQFTGKYQISDLLVERRDWRMIIGFSLVLALFAASIVLRRRNKQEPVARST